MICMVSVIVELVETLLNNIGCLQMLNLVFLPNPLHALKSRECIAQCWGLLRRELLLKCMWYLEIVENNT